MSRPSTRPGSRHLQFRKRIPRDILHILTTIPEWPRPAGWGTLEISISTGPHIKPGETGQDTFARIAATTAATFTRLRIGPEDLSDTQIAALAGEAFALATGDTQASLRGNTGFTLSGYIDRISAARGLWLTDGTRDKLARALLGANGALPTATHHNETRAKGDYARPAPEFPPWPAREPKQPAKPQHRAMTLTALIAAYMTTPRLAKAMPAPGTFKAYRVPLRRLVAFLNDPQAGTVTAEDLLRYRHARLTEGVTDTDRLSRATTVNGVDMVAIRSLFAWACDGEQHDPAKGPLLRDNPALLLKIKTKAAMGITGKDHPGFHDSEVRAILQAALAHEIGNANPALDRAKRWTPWIAAYTGARITSICNLTAADIETTQGVLCIRFPAEKGIPHPRYVPVHEHLLAQGLAEMIKAHGQGPLFYDPARRRNRDAVTPQGQICGSDIGEWIRKELGITRRTVSPNHGWRATFITIANDPEATGQPLPATHVHYFSGHSAKGLGVSAEFYDRPPFKSLAASMRHFPRYDLTDPERPEEPPESP